MKPLIIFCGRSGSGKDYVAQALGLVSVIGNTTRQPRKGEKNYNYYTKKYYEEDVDKNTIATPTTYCNNYYWTWIKDIENAKYDYSIVDFNGIKDFVKDLRAGKIRRQIQLIYVECPWYRRAKNMHRRGDSYKSIIKRILNDRKSFAGAKEFILQNHGFLLNF